MTMLSPNDDVTVPSTASGKRIGLLGGSFNPAHEGHLHISREALKRLGLDEIWWLVSPQNPLKSKDDMLDYDARIASAKKIAKNTKKIYVSDIESQFETNYSYNTIKNLQKNNPENQFVWLMGADNLASFHKWYRWEDIMHMLPIAVFDRAPFTFSVLKGRAAMQFRSYRLPDSKARALATQKTPCWCYLLIRRHPASSTEIRTAE